MLGWGKKGKGNKKNKKWCINKLIDKKKKNKRWFSLLLSHPFHLLSSPNSKDYNQLTSLIVLSKQTDTDLYKAWIILS